jgi:hypothetical protein
MKNLKLASIGIAASAIFGVAAAQAADLPVLHSLSQPIP